MNNGNMPAMPMTCHDTAFDFGDLPEVRKGLTIGLSKREYFAAMAMQGIITHTTMSPDLKNAAERAVYAADALLKALEANNE